MSFKTTTVVETTALCLFSLHFQLWLFLLRLDELPWEFPWFLKFLVFEKKATHGQTRQIHIGLQFRHPKTRFTTPDFYIYLP